MHSFLCFSKIGFLHDIDLYLGSLSLDDCNFDSKQLSLPVAISACRAAPMGANPLGHTFKPLTLYDISIYTIYFSHPQLAVLCFEFRDVGDAFFQGFFRRKVPFQQIIRLSGLPIRLCDAVGPTLWVMDHANLLITR